MSEDHSLPDRGPIQPPAPCLSPQDWMQHLEAIYDAMDRGQKEAGLERISLLLRALDQDQSPYARGYIPSTPLPNDGQAERQYLDLVQDILDRGVIRDDRTGTGTYAIHGATMRYDISDGTIPLLTTKRIPWKAVIKELIWFLNGETNIRSLVQNGVHIWSDWPYKKYVQTTGSQISMQEFEQAVAKDAYFATTWGNLGPVYGKQWRRWQGPDGKIYDQISDLVRMLKTNPTSRRLLFHGWNVADIDQMALPPCHLLYQFFVADGKLSCSLYQRSVDTGLGLGFNQASCAVLVRMLAQQCDLEPGEVFWIGHDVHVYTNHVAALRTQLERTPRPAPKLEILRKPATLFDYTIDDFALTGYDPHPHIPMDVAV